ncbi:death domain-associated protein 6 [Polymixia lowei]
MAVAPASMAERIIILDDDEEESPQTSFSAAKSSCQRQANHISPLKAKEPVPTHITQSPFASAKKDSHVLQAENQRLFTEFVEYCSALTQDCPEVLTFLHTKHSKASPEFLSSVEFRNTLGRCLTRAQANRAKAFVYINELCTVLRQHTAKRRQSLVKSTSASVSSLTNPVSIKRKDKSNGKAGEEEDGAKREEETAVDDEQPSTSGLGEDREEKKTKRASRKQIAYLENLLKVYNDEIRRLQEKDMSLEDLEAEDSGYIQEHRLKRKMMKIYDKLCELKGCNSLTGRVIEQRIAYNGTRYPEVNKKIERFINSPEAQQNPPDYPDILQQVLRANNRYNLCLSRKQVNQIAQEAFRETGSRLQERRHLDLVYNFGSHLTDFYKPATDPALSDPSLLRKLRSNREVALSSLEQVITKYAVKQDDTAEQERSKRLEKDRQEKEKEEKQGEETKQENGDLEEEQEAEEEEEEEEEDDVSSDTDIEEEIQASTQQAGPDEDDEEEDDSNEAEQANKSAMDEEPGTELSGSASEEETRSIKKDEEAEEKEPVTSGISPVSNDDKPGLSPLSGDPSPVDSPSQSESTELNKENQLPNSDLAGKEEAVDSSNHVPPVLVSTSTLSQDTMMDLSPAAANHASPPPSPVVISANKDSSTAMHDTQTTNGGSPPPSPVATRIRKRKREQMATRNHTISQTIIHESEVDIPLDMGVVSSSPPESTRADTPTQDLVTSSQSTPPPKKNKVNVATQCDPDEIIVLSDSE